MSDEQNIDDLSIEELDKALADVSGEYLEPGDEPLAVDVGAPEPSPEPEVAEQPDPEPAPDDETQQSERTEAVEPVEAGEADVGKPQPGTEDEEVSEADILNAKLNELMLQKDHWERVAGRHGGEMDLLRKQLSELRDGVASARASRVEDTDGLDAPPQRTQPEPSQPAGPRNDEFALWVIRQAATEALSTVKAAHSDWDELSGEISEVLSTKGDMAELILTSSTPTEAAAATTRLLEDAHYQASQKRQVALRTALETKRADQISNKSRAKKKAAISGSGSSAPEQPKEKSLDDMSIEELDKGLDRATGGRW